MPDNQGLAHLSDHLLIVAVVLYSLAVIAFAADFAFGRRSPVVTRAGAAVRDRVPAGVAAGAGRGRRAGRRRGGRRGARRRPVTGAAGGATGRSGSARAAARGATSGRGAGRDRLVRIALTLTRPAWPCTSPG